MSKSRPVHLKKDSQNPAESKKTLVWAQNDSSPMRCSSLIDIHLTNQNSMNLYGISVLVCCRKLYAVYLGSTPLTSMIKILEWKCNSCWDYGKAFCVFCWSSIFSHFYTRVTFTGHLNRKRGKNFHLTVARLSQRSYCLLWLTLIFCLQLQTVYSDVCWSWFVLLISFVLSFFLSSLRCTAANKRTVIAVKVKSIENLWKTLRLSKIFSAWYKTKITTLAVNLPELCLLFVRSMNKQHTSI